MVGIDTVIYFTVTDPKAATYEIANPLQAIEQLTVTTLRNVIGGLTLEETLTSRDNINSQLRVVLDEATGKWGIRVNRVELKSVEPPRTVQEAMEKQMRAERDRRAAILTAEGTKQSQILTAEGEKQAAVLKAEGARTAAILRAEGESKAIETVFQAIHDGEPDQRLLSYQYLQMLPQLAQGSANKVFVIPSEFSQALGNLGGAIAGLGGDGAPARPTPPRRPRPQVSGPDAIDEKAAADAAEAAQGGAAAQEAAGAPSRAWRRPGRPAVAAPPPAAQDEPAGAGHRSTASSRAAGRHRGGRPRASLARRGQPAGAAPAGARAVDGDADGQLRALEPREPRAQPLRRLERERRALGRRERARRRARRRGRGAAAGCARCASVDQQLGLDGARRGAGDRDARGPCARSPWRRRASRSASARRGRRLGRPRRRARSPPPPGRGPGVDRRRAPVGLARAAG